jgi:hypothetical protein
VTRSSTAAPGGLLAAALILGACAGASAPPADDSTKAVYNQTTGRLEQIVSDRNRDGQPDTWAHMSGTLVERIEIDRNSDGSPDRWEHYAVIPTGTSVRSSADGRTIITHAEEANGPDAAITRREFFESGEVARVEEDTDLNGSVDKWEQYRDGMLVHVALDLQGKGFADRRLVYGPSGNVERVEADPDGDGRFEPVAPEPSTAPTR